MLGPAWLAGRRGYRCFSVSPSTRGPSSPGVAWPERWGVNSDPGWAEDPVPDGAGPGRQRASPVRRPGPPFGDEDEHAQGEQEQHGDEDQ
jgi:hypothetical protein